jgi:uncharacterized protein (UPF0212 family)
VYPDRLHASLPPALDSTHSPFIVSAFQLVSLLFWLEVFRSQTDA